MSPTQRTKINGCHYKKQMPLPEPIGLAASLRCVFSRHSVLSLLEWLHGSTRSKPTTNMVIALLCFSAGLIRRALPTTLFPGVAAGAKHPFVFP